MKGLLFPENNENTVLIKEYLQTYYLNVYLDGKI